MILATHVELSRSQDLHRTMKKAHGRTPRSRWDQTAIAVRSSRDRGSFSVESERRFFHLIGRRSTDDQDHDRRTIVARSRRDRGVIVVPLKQKLRRNYHKSGSHDTARGNRFHDPAKPLPRPLQLPTIIRLIFSLKTHVFSLCSSTFDRFMKELSEFRGRSLVHRGPPAFRLDCEAIGAGLIANFSLISSNFPLEFRTSARKNLSKFASIHEN